MESEFFTRPQAHFMAFSALFCILGILSQEPKYAPLLLSLKQ